MTVIRNGIRLGYPFLEVIRAALPICDEYLVVVGRGDDGTLEAVQALAAEEPRVRIVESEWSPLVVPAKCVLAQQTNIGVHLCRGTWVLALQGNEVLHERDLPRLRALLEEYADDPRTEALLFERLTFFADYAHVVSTYPERYKWTARAVKPGVGSYAVRDAMNFAVFDRWSTQGRDPRARDTGIDLYRYGLVHTGDSYARKMEEAPHLGAEARGFAASATEALVGRLPAAHLAEFRGTHPAVMAARVAAHDAPLTAAAMRTRETARERRRRLESAWYRRFGFPRWRHVRYRLLGRYADKQRDAY